ncbi:hypothetical protein D3C78_1203350 [compost metagenome]
MANRGIIHRRFIGIECQIGDIHPRSQGQTQTRIVAQAGQLACGWPGEDITLAGKQFRQSTRSTRPQINHHLRHQRRTAPEMVMALQADVLTGTIFCQLEGPRPDWLAVQ